MEFAESKAALERHLAAVGVDPKVSPILDVCRACLGFYAEVRADGIVPLEEDGDMFLFQWGRSKYDRRPQDFHIDLVRQFVVPMADDEEPDEPYEEYFQLHCTVWMPPEPFASIENGHEWIYRPDHAAAFLAKLSEHPALVRARHQRQTACEITFEKV